MDEHRLLEITVRLDYLRPQAEALGIRTLVGDASDLLSEVRRLRAWQRETAAWVLEMRAKYGPPEEGGARWFDGKGPPRSSATWEPTED